MPYENSLIEGNLYFQPSWKSMRIRTAFYVCFVSAEEVGAHRVGSDAGWWHVLAPVALKNAYNIINVELACVCVYQLK